MSFSSMKTFLVVAIVGAVIAAEVSALDIKCKGLPITMTEEQITRMKTCAKTVGVDAPEKMTPEKIGCFSKCMFERKELVDENGKPHKENINKVIDASMPEPVREDAKAKFATCLDQFGGTIDPKDASCATYAPLAMCTTKAMKEVCM